MRAFYSIVQYMPDGGRSEAANAGVVLFVPDKRLMEVRCSKSLQRIKRFFHPDRSDLRRISSALDAIKHRLELAQSEMTSEADFAQFAASRADQLRLTPPRLVMVASPRDDADELYAELVGDKDVSQPQPKARFPQLPSSVTDVFARLESERKIWRPRRIAIPEIHASIEVELAYQNGRVNFVRAESLVGGKLDQRMAKLGFDGQWIHRHPIDKKESQLVVLSADGNATNADEECFERVLQEYSVRFIRYGQALDFAREVEKTAHVIGEASGSFLRE